MTIEEKLVKLAELKELVKGFDEATVCTGVKCADCPLHLKLYIYGERMTICDALSDIGHAITRSETT